MDFEIYELYISELVFTEIKRAREPIQTTLNNTINGFQPVVLKINAEVERLASIYMSEGFLPWKAFEDLLHIAVATVNKMDILISWNLRHIVKFKCMLEVNRINVAEGYRELKISTVEVVLPYED